MKHTNTTLAASELSTEELASISGGIAPLFIFAWGFSSGAGGMALGIYLAK
jgi:lactobin A/cerein 7B family class IIb bacteriocin